VTVTFPYPPDVELAMQIRYRSLRENDRRRYAAVEVAKLGHGGLDYLTTLLGCDAKTVRHGQQDLQQLADQDLEDIAPDPRVRRPGGGCKPATESLPDLVPSFHAVLEDHTAGDPMRAEVIWTDLTPREISAALMEKDLYVSEQVIRQLLDDEGYRRRQIEKYLDMGAHEDRNAQFENIARIKQDYLGSPDPDPEHRYQEAGALGHLLPRGPRLYAPGVAGVRPRLPQLRRRGRDPLRAL